MRIGGGHRGYKTGVVAVVGLIRNSPYLAGFKFDASKDGSSEQPWTSYAAPSTTPSLSNQFTNLADIAVSPENNKIVLGGYGSNGNIQIYDFGIQSGFGSRSLYAESYTGDFTWVTGLAFSQDKKALAVTTDQIEAVYNWSNGSITGQRWRKESAGGDGTNDTMMAGVNLWPYDQEYRDGDDEMFCGAMRQRTHGKVFQFRTRRMSDGSQIYTHSIFSGGAGWGFLNYPANISPLLIGGSRTVFFQTNNQTLSDRGVNGQYQVSDGAAVNYPAGYDGSVNRLENQYSSYGFFDPHGRAIVAREDTNNIKLWTQSTTDGSFTEIADYNSDIGSNWSAGKIHSMFYDKDQDILFVCSESSPYLTAVQMSETGFVKKYADMATPVGSAFVRASLVYDEKWKSHNS